MGVEDQVKYKMALQAVKDLRHRYQPETGRATSAELPRLIHGLSLFSSWKTSHTQLHNSILHGFFFVRNEDWLKNRRFMFDQCCRNKGVMRQHLEDARKFSPLATTLEDITGPLRRLGPALDDDAMAKIKKLYDLEQERLRELLANSRISTLANGDILASFLDEYQLNKSCRVYRIAAPAVPFNSALAHLRARGVIEPQELLRRMRADFTGIPMSIRVIRDTLWPASSGLIRPHIYLLRIVLDKLISSNDMVSVDVNYYLRFMCLSDKIPEALRDDSHSGLLLYYAKLRLNFARKRVRPFTVKKFTYVLNKDRERYNDLPVAFQDGFVRGKLQALVALSLLRIEDPNAKREVYHFT
ncbi:hypothetical protein PAPHI01_1129 [Pancytospora philotis]|nr:hypothetical protein PAPHI01_1129 [Pancytospora philotis]